MIRDPGIHEIEIKKYFNNLVEFECGAPKFNVPLVILLFTNRSGSNLFADYITNLGLGGGFEEYFNFDNVVLHCDKFGIASFPDYVENIARTHVAEGVAFGVKANLDQMCMLVRWGVTEMFKDVIVLHVERSDLLDQAISMSIAIQTGQWTSQIEPINEHVEFKFDEVSEIIEYNSRMNTSGKIFAEALNYRYERFIYETFSLNASDSMKRVSIALGLGELNLEIPDARIQKQAGERNIQFREKYLSLLKARNFGRALLQN
jgi:trehalose 2-sulfotransferase